jgi:hypothetical protein
MRPLPLPLADKIHHPQTPVVINRALNERYHGAAEPLFDAPHQRPMKGNTVNTDPILYWNDVANEANRTAHTTPADSEKGSRGPCGSSRAYAIVHLAMHDAYFAINPSPEGTWLDAADLPPVPAGADVDAAVAGAAHTALSALYPAQTGFLDARHAAAGLVSGKPGADGHTVGAAIAQLVLAARAADPGIGDQGYASSVAPGHHRHDPDADPKDHGYHAPYYGARARCFASTTHYQLLPAPAPGTAEYQRAAEEVRGKGIAPHLMGTLPVDPATGVPLFTARTPTETTIGLFWAYDGAKGLGTPPRLYNQIIRQVAERQGNTPAENARLFALVNAAMGDAGIMAWDDKYVHDLWRPILGIREHDSALGPTATPGSSLDSLSDPSWLPLGAPATNETGKKNFTPPFPAYPSGHATFGAAAFQSVRRYYNRDCGYSPDNLSDGIGFVSEELNGVNQDNLGAVRPKHVRNFPNGGLWRMIEENGRSRVFLGVHWIFDAFATDASGAMDLTQNIGGVRLGLDIADDIAANGLKRALAAAPRVP